MTDAATAIPSFGEATASFSDFLNSNGYEKELIWIFREDVSVKYWGRIWIRTPLPDQNERLAERLFDFGKSKGHGVNLAVFCLLDMCPCAYVWVPEDDLDAQYALLSGLKLSVPEQPRKAARLARGWPSRVKHLLRGRTQDDPFLAEVPLRCEAEGLAGDA